MDNKYLDLYHPRILQLDKNPFHFEKIDTVPFLVANNPICGDRFKIYQYHKDGKSSFAFYGHGCAVSKASTSILVEFLDKYSVEDVRDMAESYVLFIEDKKATQCPIAQLAIFSQVKSHPSRIDCATLAWQALLKKT